MKRATRAVGYARVSLEKQADLGISLDMQRSKIESYAALYDLELVEMFVDAGASAKTLDRPGLQAALNALDSGRADALLVMKLDRLTRSVRDLGDLVDRFSNGRFALLSMAENIDTRSASGRLVLNILGSVSQWEAESTRERTSAAMQHKRALSEYTGGKLPYGYRLAADGTRLEPVPNEQAVIRHATRLRQKGMKIAAIARALSVAGMRTRSGRRFQSTQVARMLAACNRGSTDLRRSRDGG